MSGIASTPTSSLDLLGRPGGVWGAGAVPAHQAWPEPVNTQLSSAPLLLKPVEVAELLGVSRSKVFAMLAAGELPVVRLGRVVRVPRRDLEAWLHSATAPATSRGLLARIATASR